MKKSSTEKLKVYSVRVNPEHLELAQFHKLDIGQLFRKSLEEAIDKKTGKCPQCGNALTWKKIK